MPLVSPEHEPTEPLGEPIFKYKPYLTFYQASWDHVFNSSFPYQLNTSIPEYWIVFNELKWKLLLYESNLEDSKYADLNYQKVCDKLLLVAHNIFSTIYAELRSPP